MPSAFKWVIGIAVVLCSLTTLACGLSLFFAKSFISKTINNATQQVVDTVSDETALTGDIMFNDAARSDFAQSWQPPTIESKDTLFPKSFADYELASVDNVIASSVFSEHNESLKMMARVGEYRNSSNSLQIACLKADNDEKVTAHNLEYTLVPQGGRVVYGNELSDRLYVRHFKTKKRIYLWYSKGWVFRFESTTLEVNKIAELAEEYLRDLDSSVTATKQADTTRNAEDVK